MATRACVKPFSPEETQRILHHLHQPAVFQNMTQDWPVLQWTVEHLSNCLGDRVIRFRLGRRDQTTGPLFETQCSYVEAKLVHFLSWTRSQSGADVGPFSDYPHSEYWAYADYKYIAILFQELPSIFEDVMWSDFGFKGRNGRESTLWIGTEGANTPCHQDSYGCNLVLQVQGRKRWHLFPPEETSHLYPTRIPYEESSVFSKVDVLLPDLKRFPEFKRASAHTVTLQPGQVLYVPRHWWHYVESVDPVTVSVNSWIELEVDDKARVGEALTKAVVCALKTTSSDDNTDNWLNPTEEGVVSHKENMQYVNLAVRAYEQRQRLPSKKTQDKRGTRPLKRDSSGQVQKKSVDESASFGVHFGPNLIPVCCEKNQPEARGITDCSLSTEAAPRTEPVPGDRPHCGAHGCSRSCEFCDDMSEHTSEHLGLITTNDLLDCLVHPDIVSRITELLLERNTGVHRNTTSS
ncbi:HSPB1-associated protein 1 homolog [Genypterus blacodes]|uniref:HSPB1-associated protein 1 homolog n=1 Tax=Genypterus blacodes TaxID=154954 RepID=UPI003F760FD4